MLHLLKLMKTSFDFFPLTSMWSETFSFSFPDTAKGSRLFETDIKLTRLDYARVDTSLTNNAPGADVKVQNIEKRKAIRSRRKIWPSRIIPVILTVGEENSFRRELPYNKGREC